MMTSAFTGSLMRCRLQMEQYLNIKQLSTQLGLSVRTIRSWITDPERPLPCFRLKGKLLFSSKEVVSWLENHRVIPIDVELIAQEVLDSFQGDKSEQGKEEKT